MPEIFKVLELYYCRTSCVCNDLTGSKTRLWPLIGRPFSSNFNLVAFSWIRGILVTQCCKNVLYYFMENYFSVASNIPTPLHFSLIFKVFFKDYIYFAKTSNIYCTDVPDIHLPMIGCSFNVGTHRGTTRFIWSICFKSLRYIKKKYKIFVIFRHFLHNFMNNQKTKSPNFTNFVILN